MTQMTSDGPRLSVTLTFDFDAMSVWIGSHNSNNPAMISRGEFGAVAVPRILALLDKHGIRTTFFVPGHTALAYPELIRDIRDRGHAPCEHVRELLDRRLADLDAQLRQLRSLRETIAQLRDEARVADPETCSPDQVCRYL